MTYNICIDMANTEDIIIKLIKALEAIPVVNLQFQRLLENSLVNRKTGEEVYRIYTMEMTSDAPQFIVCEALERSGFKQTKYDKTTFFR